MPTRKNLVPHGERKPALSPEARALSAVFDVGQALATTGDHEQLLSNVIKAVQRTVGATAGGFMLFDPVTEELVLQKPAFGVHARDVVEAYRVQLSAGGNAARVFLSREPYLTNDARNDPRMLQRFIERFDARSTLTVPLVLGDQPLGVFHAINKQGGDFTADDAALLSLIAPLLASCLQSAQMYKAIETERRQLSRVMAVHRELTRAVADGQGIEGLCATLQRLLTRPVLVLDALRRPLAASGIPIPGPRAQSALGRALLEGRDVQRARLPMSHRGTLALAAVAIPINDETVGHILVVEEGAELDSIDIKAVEQAALVFALEILKERSAFEAERRVTGDLLGELFGSDLAPAAARRVLATLGVGEQGPWRVARIGFTAADEFAAVADPQMRRVLMETLRGRGIEAPVLPWRKGFIALLDAAASLQLQAPGMLARLRRVLTKATASTRDLQFAVGVGREESSPDRLGWSLETAEQALLAAQRLGTGEQVMFAEELGVYRLLLGGNRREDYQDFMVQTLGALLDPPHQRLLETLETLTRCEFSLRLTARQLGVHENTVKYRLRRITEMVGGDPARGEHRLEIELALKIRHLRMR